MDCWEETVELPITIRIPTKEKRSSRGRPELHVELANLDDDVASVRDFASRWCLDRVQTEGQARRYWAARDDLRARWRGKKVSNNVWNLAEFLNGLEAVKQGLAFVSSDFWTSIPLLFFKDQLRGRTAICANPACPKPHFIRKRKTQKYCGAGPCIAQAQREQKREWWNRNRAKGAKG